MRNGIEQKKKDGAGDSSYQSKWKRKSQPVIKNLWCPGH